MATTATKQNQPEVDEVEVDSGPVDSYPLTARLMARIEKTPEKERTAGERQFLRANALESERSELGKRVTSNRDYLRLMEQNEELDNDLADWLDDFYPLKEKGQTRSPESIERTRAAKAAARS